MSALPTRVVVSRRQLETNTIEETGDRAAVGRLERSGLADIRNSTSVMSRCLTGTGWLKHHFESLQRSRPPSGKQAMSLYWEPGVPLRYTCYLEVTNSIERGHE